MYSRKFRNCTANNIRKYSRQMKCHGVKLKQDLDFPIQLQQSVLARKLLALKRLKTRKETLTEKQVNTNS